MIRRVDNGTLRAFLRGGNEYFFNHKEVSTLEFLRIKAVERKRTAAVLRNCTLHDTKQDGRFQLEQRSQLATSHSHPIARRAGVRNASQF